MKKQNGASLIVTLNEQYKNYQGKVNIVSSKVKQMILKIVMVVPLISFLLI